jgi:hypothetical protein
MPVSKKLSQELALNTKKYATWLTNLPTSTGEILFDVNDDNLVLKNLAKVV